MYCTAKGNVIHSRQYCRGSFLLRCDEKDAKQKRQCRVCPWPCMICMSEDVVKGNNCHPLCDSCTTDYVQTLLTNPNWNGADVPCPCGSGRLLQSNVALPSSRTSLQVYKPCILEECLDSVSNLRCPHCRCVFVSFDGCCAITCNCKGCFCAFCLEPFDTDKECHDHVLYCSLNPNPKDYFASLSEWEGVMSTQKTIRLWNKAFEVSYQYGCLLGAAMMLYVSERSDVYIFPPRFRFVMAMTVGLTFLFPRCVICAFYTILALHLCNAAKFVEERVARWKRMFDFALHLPRS